MSYALVGARVHHRELSELVPWKLVAMRESVAVGFHGELDILLSYLIVQRRNLPNSKPASHYRKMRGIGKAQNS